mmetsp:Transcript_17251/g.51715  ORF Transcript_17251/g.51715 Transcript_17251/m.51715 type:complete len:213 (+) Transcript_17251:470-1108(+)
MVHHPAARHVAHSAHPLGASAFAGGARGCRLVHLIQRGVRGAADAQQCRARRRVPSSICRIRAAALEPRRVHQSDAPRLLQVRQHRLEPRSALPLERADPVRHRPEGAPLALAAQGLANSHGSTQLLDEIVQPASVFVWDRQEGAAERLQVDGGLAPVAPPGCAALARLARAVEETDRLRAHDELVPVLVGVVLRLAETVERHRRALVSVVG